MAVLAGLGAASGLVSGCSSQEETTEVRVAAAASLHGSFETLAREFTAANPQYTVAPMAVDGSQVLATQVVQGAPVDVLATADEPSMQTVTDAGAVDQAVTFATNRLQWAVAPGNPRGVDDWSDLAALDVAVCAPQVPCGRASQTLLEQAGQEELRPVSQETSVTGVVSRVASGEADAGLVYVTDVAASDGRLLGLDLPLPEGADTPVNRYRIGVTGRAGQDGRAEAAQAFRDFVLSPRGQELLQEDGFGAP